MPSHPLRRAIDHLIRVARPRPIASSDRELLAAFADRRDEQAFAELVRRHGSMVRGVCRRVLGQGPDADDAFQAAFLLLARKAGATGWSESVGPWLYAATLRIARKARVAAARRCRYESQAAPLTTASDPLAAAALHELSQVLDEELSRLSERLRAPLVLCYLEGLARDEAAKALSLPLGTLKERLARGRSLLRVRLGRRGVTLAVAGVSAALAESPVGAATAAATARVAAAYIVGETIAPAVAALLLGPAVGWWTTVGASVVLSATAMVFMASRERERAESSLPQPNPPAAPAPGPPAKTDIHGDPLPPGAVARLGTVRLRPASAAAFTPDGKAVVTAGWAGLRLWDVADGKLLAHADVPFGSVRFVVAPDGRWVVGESRGGVTFCELRTGQHVAVPLVGENALHITALAFSVDSSRLAVATLEARTDRIVVRVLSVPDGRELLRHTGHKLTVLHLAFTGRGALVSIDQSYNMCFYDAPTNQLLRRGPVAEDAPGGIDVARLSPDGRWLVRAPRVGPAVVWSTLSGQRQCVLDGVDGVVSEVDFTVDGQSLAAFVVSADQPRHLGVWDVTTGGRLRQMVLPSVKAQGNPTLFRIAPDGQTAAVFGEGHSALRLWNVATGRPLPLPDGHAGSISSLAVTADGRWVVSADSSEVRGWDLASCQPRWTVPSGLARGAAVLPDGQTLLHGGADGGLEFREVATGRLVREEPARDPDDRETGFQVTADGATALSLRFLPAWPPQVVLNIRRLGPGGGPDRKFSLGETYGGVFSPDGRWLASATGTAREFTVIDTTTGQPRAIPTNLPGAMSLRVSPDSRLVAVAAANRSQLHLVELLSGRMVQTINGLDGHAAQAWFSPDGQTLVVRSQERSLVLYETATGRERLRLGGFDATAFAVTFTPDGARLLTGHNDGTILVWDVAAAMKR